MIYFSLCGLVADLSRSPAAAEVATNTTSSSGEEVMESRKYVFYERASIFILFITVIGLATYLGVHDRGDPSCPHDWIGYRGKCYYVSETEDNWNSSQSFCSAQGASLTTVEDGEKVFLSRITDKRSYWIGLHRDPGQPWRWPNGKNSLMEVMGEGGNCAYLNDEGSASSSRCSTDHHWICSKFGIV